MPLLWRYLLRKYLQVFFLSVTGFIAVLLVTRFQDIARFMASGAGNLHVLSFIAYQIPFILPLAIPISCLISAIILFQQLSRSGELTTLRSSGIGLSPIAFPLIVSGAIIASLNFACVSEVAPKCRALSKGLAYQMTAINPLSLLQKQTLIKLKNTHVDMNVLKSGQYAEDVLCIMRSLSNQRLVLVLAKNLALHNEKLIGKDVTFISSIDARKSDCHDHLVIENQGEMETDKTLLAEYLRSSDWNLGYDYLNFRMLLAKKISEKGTQAKYQSRAWQEMARRISLGLAAFTFTLIGVSFGMEISRTNKWKGSLWAIALATLYFVAFVSAKSLKHNWVASVICYLIPHLVILLFCLKNFRRIARGWEA